MTQSVAAVTVAALILSAAGACSRPATLDAEARREIAAEIERTVKEAYDLSRPDFEERLLALFPDTGRVVSASVGTVVTDRDSLASGIRYFYRAIGVNMRQPQWIWDRMHIDVLSPDAAVMTAIYQVPHRTPRNVPHLIRGAWTAVFRREGSRWVIVQEHLSDAPALRGDSAVAPGTPTPQSHRHNDTTGR